MQQLEEPSMDDLVIRGGEVIDGSGVPGRVADVVVTNGRIVAIDSGQTSQRRRLIDATGQVVAPGLSTFTRTPTSPCP